MDRTSNVNESRLYATTDAAVWAQEFKKVQPDVDEDLMLGWFANAFETAQRLGGVCLMSMSGPEQRAKAWADFWPTGGCVPEPTSRERAQMLRMVARAPRPDDALTLNHAADLIDRLAAEVEALEERIAMMETLITRANDRYERSAYEGASFSVATDMYIILAFLSGAAGGGENWRKRAMIAEDRIEAALKITDDMRSAGWHVGKTVEGCGEAFYEALSGTAVGGEIR